MYTAHLDSLTVEVWSPFLRRGVFISPQQYRLIAAVFDGFKGTQRELAALVGYTIGGCNDTLQQMRRLGLIFVQTTRGRFGCTTVRARRGIRVLNRAVANVRERLVKKINLVRSVSAREHSSSAEPPITWEALGLIFAGDATRRAARRLSTTS